MAFVWRVFVIGLHPGVKPVLHSLAVTCGVMSPQNLVNQWFDTPLKLYREHVSLLSPGQLAPHVLFHVCFFLLFYAFVCGANKILIHWFWLIDPWFCWRTVAYFQFFCCHTRQISHEKLYIQQFKRSWSAFGSPGMDPTGYERCCFWSNFTVYGGRAKTLSGPTQTFGKIQHVNIKAAMLSAQVCLFVGICTKKSDVQQHILD